MLKIKFENLLVILVLTLIVGYDTLMTTMLNRETEDREYAPLEMIKDNYPKYVLTRNDMIQKRNGIIHENIPQFMVAGKLF